MTTIALELTPELEQQLRDEAAKQGFDPKHYILNTLSWHLGSAQRRVNLLTQTETDLLQKINIGLSQETWERYHALTIKRRAETLTIEEQTRLIEISDQIEQANTHRIEALIELANLRNTSLSALIQELGIKAPSTPPLKCVTQLMAN
jgi:hypothetical protein